MKFKRTLGARVAMVVVVLAALLGCKKSGSSTQVEEVTAPPDSIPQKAGWTLVWNDEFNGTTLDMSKWEYEVNGDGGGNNELQYYTANRANSFVDSGALTIRAVKETYFGKEYTSARLRTRNKGDWKYGYIEARARLPYGQGMWPAIWMLPTDWAYGPWPKSGEIDIMECLGHETWKAYGTIHFASSGGAHQQAGGTYTITSGSSFAGDFHTFAVEWDSLGFKWFVDGKQYYSTAKGAPFDKRFHLLLNVAVGGNWPGSPNEFTPFPQTMVVDYVRVYQKKP